MLPTKWMAGDCANLISHPSMSSHKPLAIWLRAPSSVLETRFRLTSARPRSTFTPPPTPARPGSLSPQSPVAVRLGPQMDSPQYGRGGLQQPTRNLLLRSAPGFLNALPNPCPSYACLCFPDPKSDFWSYSQPHPIYGIKGCLPWQKGGQA